VCYPISLLDLILRCDEQDLHRVVWTDDLLDELVQVWVRNGARSIDSARSVTDQIRAVFPAGHVDRSSYEHLVPDMPGSDPDDHPHAAASVAVAPSILLTANTADFPAELLGPLGVTVEHPDDYFVGLLDVAPDSLLDVLCAMADQRRRPPMTLEEVLAALRRAGLKRFAAEFHMVHAIIPDSD
jgi:hypothetical protein